MILVFMVPVALAVLGPVGALAGLAIYAIVMGVIGTIVMFVNVFRPPITYDKGIGAATLLFMWSFGAVWALAGH